MPRKYEDCHWEASQPHESCLLPQSLHQGLDLNFYIQGPIGFLPAMLDDI